MHFQRNITRIQDQDDLNGVPSSGTILRFDGTSFIPINFALSNLNDATINTPVDTDALIYSQAQNKWVNNRVLDGGNY